jgi:hypothetical protein
LISLSLLNLLAVADILPPQVVDQQTCTDSLPKNWRDY